MEPVPWLDDEDGLQKTIVFPDANHATDEPNGLVALGANLRPETLLSAYRAGIFPWYQDGQPILWWSPDPRCVIIPEQLHISRSLHKRLRRQDFLVTADTAFQQVVAACAAPRRDGDGTWITDDMAAAYLALHELGYAHSIEVWQDQQLVGGMYGVALGEVFFGESMFSTMTDGSKIAMVYLLGQLKEWGFALLDCQVPNDHLFRMGASTISRSSFLELLHQRAERAGQAGKWHISWKYNPEGS